MEFEFDGHNQYRNEVENKLDNDVEEFCGVNLNWGSGPKIHPEFAIPGEDDSCSLI